MITSKPASLRAQDNLFVAQFGLRRQVFEVGFRSIMTSPGRRIWQRRDATGAPTQRPEWRGGDGRPFDILARKR